MKFNVSWRLRTAKLKIVTVSFPQCCLGLFCAHHLLMLLHRGSTVFFALLLRSLISMIVLLVSERWLSFWIGLPQHGCSLWSYFPSLLHSDCTSFLANLSVVAEQELRKVNALRRKNDFSQRSKPAVISIYHAILISK